MTERGRAQIAVSDTDLERTTSVPDSNTQYEYEAARQDLLDDIVPKEDMKDPKATCLFRTCCCFYYAFCCCLICEKSKAVTK